MSRGVIVHLVLLMSVTWAAPSTAVRCNTLGDAPGSCATFTSCKVGCGDGAEVELRKAIQLANQCHLDHNLPAARTIKFEPCALITLNNNNNDIASCPDKNYSRGSICLKADDITVDGAYSGGSVTFKYAEPNKCDPDDDNNGPALFVLKGNRGTVKNFKMQYFPEGIHILGGS